VEGQDYIFGLIGSHLQDSTKRADKEAVNETETAFTFERIPVAKGTSDVGYTQITLLKEIPKDMKIVVKGAFFVSAKMTNKEGHED